MTQPKHDYAIAPENNANDTPWSLALREMQGNLRSPLYWVILGSVVFVLAMAGPYFTLERLTFPERLVYWGTTVICSAILMTFLSILAYQVTQPRGWNWVLGSLLAGLIGVAPVVGSLFLAEGLATGFPAGWTQWTSFWSLALQVAPILMGTTVVVHLSIRLQKRSAELDLAAAPIDVPAATLSLTILQRKLPRHLGHEIASVRAQDHYVEVTTPKGSAMVLMRLSDAVDDLKPLNGMQVHRSWWVSLSHVTRTAQGPNGTELIMTTDQTIPVGRSFRKAFKDAMGTR